MVSVQIVVIEPRCSVLLNLRFLNLILAQEFTGPHALRTTPDGRYVYVAEITSPGRLRRFEITREYGVHKVDMHAKTPHAGLFDS